MEQTLKNSDDIRELRSALGQFPTGVAVVTAIDDNSQPVGMTINSFASISLAPALVSWSIDHQAVSHDTFAKAKNFTITVLAEHQADLAMRFATRGADKFQYFETDDKEAPILPGGCAWLKCENYRSILLGDHTMLVGKVIEFGRYPVAPLVFRGGQFQQLAGEVGSTTQAAA